jgi:hypothetical protein
MARSQALSHEREAGLGETPDSLYGGDQEGQEGVVEEHVRDAEEYFGPLGALCEGGGG